ncbi:MAG: DUF2384 domain-containing protein, partial [Actinomycetota bacterium]|nr:DUF2384 domain-containing protein [Actinomycetota bacterium]
VAEIQIHWSCSVVNFATYSTTRERHNATHREDDHMASLSALLDSLYETGVIDSADVARVSGAHARSVNRWHTAKAEPRRESEERLLELKAVVDLLRRIMRDDAARLWLRSPNPDLGYEKPLDLVAVGQYQRVIDLLLALAEGVTA